MNFARTIIPLMLMMLLNTVSKSAFSERRSQRLLNAISDTPLAKIGSNRELIKNAVEAVKRNPNRMPRVCFALDGSVSSSPYALQKNLVLIVTSVLGALRGSKFAAVRYGGIVNLISPLTGKLRRTDGFLTKVRGSFPASSRFLFIAPGLQYCVSQFALASDSGDSNMIVLLGEGKNTFGHDANSPFGAVGIAKNFLEDDSNCIVAGLVGGNEEARKLFYEITGDPSKAVSVSSWNRIGDVLPVVIGNL